MSQEDVELIRSLQPGPEVDIAELFRDDKMAEAAWAAVSSVVHDDLESSIVSQGVRSTYRGFDGLRAAWVDWLAPWDSYYAVIEDVIDLGDRVLVLPRDHGRRKDLATDVEQRGASVYTVRDDKVARVEFYTNRDEALEAVGLSEQDAHADS
jgi:ketosteroid isomerase-like protein